MGNAKKPSKSSAKGNQPIPRHALYKGDHIHLYHSPTARNAAGPDADVNAKRMLPGNGFGKAELIAAHKRQFGKTPIIHIHKKPKGAKKK